MTGRHRVINHRHFFLPGVGARLFFSGWKKNLQHNGGATTLREKLLQLLITAPYASAKKVQPITSH